MNAQEKVAEAFLDLLERREEALLGWGVVDGAFTRDELESRAEDHLNRRSQAGEDPAFMVGGELIDWLAQHRWLHRLPSTTDGPRYRTRMAEALRLLLRLKQLFPTHIQNGNWRQAPNLVSDFRLILRPRAYPKRDQVLDTVLPRLRKANGLTDRQVEVARALLRDGSGKPLVLSEFQVEATERILKGVASGQSGGTMVSAGTGSGKTLAFYLPALLTCAENLRGEPFTQVLALYPRKELLKDQFSEALTRTRMARSALDRPLRIGAFFGDTPFDEDAARKKWERRGDGYLCTFVRCPKCDAEALVWPREDNSDGRETLVCQRCGTGVGEGEVALTRRGLQSRPPDILFTTTEMLNRSISHPYSRGLFGVGARRRPSLVLLDEVHTYDGLHGAQVAQALRRWRQASAATPHFVGLSATLANPEEFFATLVGRLPGNVGSVQPQTLQEEGREYLVALRGDPVSGASLASTTIQTAMLLRRVLRAEDPDPFSAKKLFVFTDDLDATNRLYHFTRDAEGETGRGRRPEGSFANLRRDGAPESDLRYRLGQNWRLSEEIGHNLQPPAGLVIGRTTSQDAGVDSAADVLVATASLEVGFDDPDVGAVIQHKAPHSDAAFLQRKGRAGRQRGVRPWTVVVLSGYGRDRQAYRTYERMFSPVLPPRQLPYRNRYVLRIQATYALLDWLGQELIRSGIQAHIWKVVVGPPEKRTVARAQRFVLELLERLLHDSVLRASLQMHVQKALEIGADEALALLWDGPRAVLTAVVPTVRRRLERQWKRFDGEVERHDTNQPLPEFLPSALFNELNLPEVHPSDGRKFLDAMGIRQALSTFAPGHVSLRFAVGRARDRHWIEPVDGDLDVEAICPPSWREEVGFGPVRTGDELASVPILRPYGLRVAVPSREVTNSSQGRMQWHSSLVGTGRADPIDPPSSSRWSGLVAEVRFWTHQGGTPIELRRFSTGSDWERRNGGRSQRGNARFVQTAPDGSVRPVALGFAAQVDGASIHLPDLGPLHPTLASQPRLLRSLRAQRFQSLVRDSSSLPSDLNVFLREWLAQVWLLAVSRVALTSGLSLEDAVSDVRKANFGAVLDRMLRFAPLGEDEGEPAAGRLHNSLAAALGQEEVRDALAAASDVLWSDPDASWDPWLGERLRSTVGAAFLEAAQETCPQIAAEDLQLDIRSGDDDEEGTIWLTEEGLGGIGFIEELERGYAQNPRTFFNLMDGALEASDLERVDRELTAFAAMVGDTADRRRPEVVEAVAAYRRAAEHSHEDQVRAFNDLLAQLRREGLRVDHAVTTSLTARLVRPGTGPESDTAVHELLCLWDEAEKALGFELDVQSFASLATFWDSAVPTVERLLNHLPFEAGAGPAPEFQAAALDSILWARGGQLRRSSLQPPNYFHALPEVEPLLVDVLAPRDLVSVSVEQNGWMSRAKQVLGDRGRVLLEAGLRKPELLAGCIQALAAEEVDTGTLLLYATLERLERGSAGYRAVLSLEEAPQ